MTNERELVLDALMEILEKGQFMHTLVKSILDKHDYLDSGRKAFVKRCISGTVENLIAIDDIINSYAKTKTDKQKPLIRTLLRMSTYQIIYMDKVPDSAACNEAVKLANKRGFRNLSGFVNGVLRKISANKDAFLSESSQMDSVPEWIRIHLIEAYGEEKTKLILEDINKIHPITLRLRKRVELSDFVYPSEVFPDAYYVKKGIAIKDIPGYDSGDFIIQDISSMIAVSRCNITPGDSVLDVCAAPGGKSIYAYDLGGNVISRDVSEKKTHVIEENMLRCGLFGDNDHTMRTQVFDATGTDDELIEKCDVVIMDVPCSGLGVMGRKSDIRYRLKKEDIDSLLILQGRIIDASWKYVKSGGTLLYSTCTMNPSENENKVKYIIDNYPFELVEERQFFPGIDNTDGFFYAVLKRK